MSEIVALSALPLVKLKNGLSLERYFLDTYFFTQPSEGHEEVALLWERRDECPGAVPVLVCYDEIVVECGESDVKKVEAWLKKAMEDGMDEVVNDPNVGGPQVPVEVEVESSRSWAG